MLFPSVLFEPCVELLQVVLRQLVQRDAADGRDDVRINPSRIARLCGRAELGRGIILISQAVIYLKEHGDMDYAALKEKSAAVTTRFNELSAEIKDLESRMSANGELQKQIVNYAKTRAAYVEYRKAGYSKKFRAEHEADILIHQAAKKYFDSLGITKLPSVKSLREEYAGLLEQKRKAYAAYKQARQEMRELYNVKANVEHLLDVTAQQENERDQTKHRG